MVKRRGFTLVEIMIAVAILGLLTSLFTYQMSRYRRVAKKNAILANLRVVEDAKAQCVAEKGAQVGDTTTCSQAVVTAEYLKGRWPEYVDRHGGPFGSIAEGNKLEIRAVGSPPLYRGYPYEWWADDNNFDWILL